jgi:hypothetical protein
VKGVSETSIQCVTTAAINPNRQTDLDVKVRVSGRPDSSCDASDPTFCRFSYRQETTPVVHSISTRAGFPKQKIDIWGQYRMSNTKLIENILVGDKRCDRLFQGLNEDEDLASWSFYLLSCSLSP